MVHESAFHCTDLGTQIKAAVVDFTEDEAKRTCGKCGALAQTVPEGVAQPWGGGWRVLGLGSRLSGCVVLESSTQAYRLNSLRGLMPTIVKGKRSIGLIYKVLDSASDALALLSEGKPKVEESLVFDIPNQCSNLTLSDFLDRRSKRIVYVKFRDDFV